MRTRIAALLSVFALMTMSLPAAAVPTNSPVHEEIPFSFVEVLPNPCLGVEAENFYGDGVLYVHEMTNPSGNYHFNAIGYVALRTDSGFQSPSKMAGMGFFLETDNVYKYNEVDHYNSITNGEQTLRLHFKFHLTIVDDEVKVDIADVEMTCRPGK
ncbi:MAG: hypothetical protein OEX04_00365 [Acidimicrobiia bacterium]|nr:hypothetical protein [Acidimicrobiia bacterium]MDH4305908.1 hypothetical protein [Acidimicrobiia bacterium]MDH5293020.1 hypothetical protein [Acidimicrobiia bacterium]